MCSKVIKVRRMNGKLRRNTRWLTKHKSGHRVVSSIKHAMKVG